ncbi:unnamed protein product [Paramecium sonneborni]|uniref:Uncharacterized protein n=1 Tax=Paramecium sonneborni TaxID=65129 RepID=A0A8S1KJ48_9CILI|nr:unnamed protein product [Paramecium sonneborni]
MITSNCSKRLRLSNNQQPLIIFTSSSTPFQIINQFDNQQLISSCECLDCGGKVKKKILICKKELLDSPQSNTKTRFPASPQLSIQPQNMRPSNRDLSLIGSSAHFSMILINFYVKSILNSPFKKVIVYPFYQQYN